MVDDVVGITARELWAAVFVGEGGEAEAGAEIDQNFLEAADIAIRLDHRVSDRVRDHVGLGNRAVEERDTIIALQIRRVGQDQVSERHRLGVIGIRVDDLGDHVVAVFVLGGQRIERAGDVHRRVPRHVRHVHEQHVDAVGVLLRRVVDDHVHQPVRRHRRIPAEAFVQPVWAAVFVQQQMLWPMREAEVRPTERCRGLDLFGGAVRQQIRWRLLGVGRFVAETAGAIDAPK